jgi:TonB family protein
MNNLVNYLLESGISLSLFAASFLLFLRKETFFWTNRMFLLTSVMFSLVLPVLVIPVYAPVPVTLPEVTVTPYRNLLEAVIISAHQITGNVENFVVSSRLLINLWLTGVLVMTLIFIFRMVQIIRIIRKSTTESGQGYQLVLTGRDNPPFSFLRSLFVPVNHTDIPGYDRIIRHELEHIRQGHTYDILLLDILLVFQWFNPFIWLLKRAVRENHEYLVDRAVLNSGVSPEEYKQILISQVAGSQVYAASHFNYSLIKNRFKMMTKIPSRKIAGIKIISGILIALALVVIFACEQKKSTSEKILAITTQNGDITFTGTPDDVKKVSELLQSGKFEVSTIEKNNGKFQLVLKEKSTEAKTVPSQEPGIEEKTDEVFIIVEKMPEFPGGEAAFRSHIAKAVEYPVEAAKKGIQGKVYVTFVVGKDGAVKNAKIIRGVDPMLDKEALRVVNSLPKWIPGEQGGKKVSVAYTVPISFVLQ